MTECEKNTFIYKNIKPKSNRIGKIWIRENKKNFSNFINSNFSNQNLKQESKINIFHPDYNVREGEWSSWSPYKLSEWIGSLGENMSSYKKVIIDKNIQGASLHSITPENITALLDIKIESDAIFLLKHIAKLTRIVYQEHQTFVAEYLHNESPYRGLLLYHGLGSGKTAASILITEGFPNRSCVVMLPASLRDNYVSEINKFSEFKSDFQRGILKKYHWCFRELSVKNIKDLSQYDNILSPYGINKIGFKYGLNMKNRDKYTHEDKIPLIFDHTHKITGILIPKKEGDTFLDLPLNEQIFIEKKTKKTSEQLSSSRWKFYSSTEFDSLDKTIINKYKKFKIVRKGGDYQFGIWMIDDNSDSLPNFNSLSEKQQQEIEITLYLIFNQKYKFIHYNSGQFLSISIFRLMNENSKSNLGLDLTKENSINKIKTKEIVKRIVDGELDNPFDNKIIVIDEIHNLVSSITGSFEGSSYVARVIYDLIMSAKNIKVILLSGTPCINDPFELGILFNILHGRTKIFTCYFEPTIKTSDLSKIIEGDETIDFFNIRRSENDKLELKLTRNPKNFINYYGEEDPSNKKLGIIFNTNSNYFPNDDEFKKYIIHLFNEQNITVNDSKVEDNSFSLFQEDKQAFSNKYIDTYYTKIKSREDFIRKIIGKVSYFNETTALESDGGSVFPELIRLPTPVYANLSIYQFIFYCKARSRERELEKKFKKKGPDDKESGYYRVLSRNALLFSFPPEIERVWPSDLRKDINNDLKNNDQGKTSSESLDDEIMYTLSILIDNYLQDNSDLDYNEAKQIVTLKIEELKKLDSLPIDTPQMYKEYIKLLNKSKSTITSHEKNYSSLKEDLLKSLYESNTYLKFGKKVAFDLEMLSPKYVEMFKNIQHSPGNILCYSQFRSVEGIGIFSQVLKKHGYHDFNIGIEKTPESGDMIRLKISNNTYINCRIAHIDSDIIILNKNEVIHNLKKIAESNHQDDIRDITQQFLKATKDIKIDTPSPYFDYLGELVGNSYLELSYSDWKDNISIACYANWTRSTGPQILEVFNDHELNRYGQNIQIIFITQSGAEGLNLYNIRQVHIMEPFWNIIKIDQVIGRARRISSHRYLPIAQRNVTVYEYISKFTPEQLTNTWNSKELSELGVNLEQFSIHSYSKEITSEDEGKTSDQNLKILSEKKNELISSFIEILRQGAVDCQFNMKENIKSIGKIKCLNTDNLSTINENFIYVPDSDYKYISVKTTSPLVSNKTLVKLNINGYIISGFINSGTFDQECPIFDLYHYYGLLPGVTSGSYDYKVIGKLLIDHLGNYKRLFTQELSNDINKLELYSKSEQVRQSIEDAHSKFANIPKDNITILKWCHLIREALQPPQPPKETEIETTQLNQDQQNELKELFKTQTGKDYNSFLNKKELKKFIFREVKKEGTEKFEEVLGIVKQLE